MKQSEIVFYEGIPFARISKSQARKLYKKQTVLIMPCKANPTNIMSAIGEISNDKDFDTFVNAFEYYNCNYEMGYYSSFWINIYE